MINGIMKLFYTEVVKNKMSKLPNGQYEVNDQFKKVQGISIKIDKVLFLVFKIFWYRSIFNRNNICTL